METRRSSTAAFAGRLVLPVILIATTIAASRLLLPVHDTPARAPLTALVYACAGIFALLFFSPRGRGAPAALGWSALVASLVAVVAVLDPVARPVAHALPALVFTVFLVCATLMVLKQDIATPALFALLALASLAPVFAAPLVEAAGNPERLTMLVVSASPLTALAVSLDLDYLRTGWFYAHSALGSLRYTYPAWGAACLLLAFLPTTAVLRAVLPLCSRTLRTADEAYR